MNTLPAPRFAFGRLVVWALVAIAGHGLTAGAAYGAYSLAHESGGSNGFSGLMELVRTFFCVGSLVLIACGWGTVLAFHRRDRERGFGLLTGYLLPGSSSG